MITWKIRPIELALKFPWALSRGSSTEKTNFVITVGEEGIEGRGEVAFNTRYGESASEVLSQFQHFVETVPGHFGGIEALSSHLRFSEMFPSLKAGIEIAYVNFIAALSDRPVPELLGLHGIKRIKTSFSIPIMEPGKIESFIKEHNLSRFTALKVKIAEEGALDLCREIARHYSGPLRLDANEGFSDVDSFARFAEQVIKDCEVDFFEQPLKASDHDGLLAAKKISPRPLIADESLTDSEVTEYHKERFHGVNIKLMKAGGYLKALRQMRDARSHGLKVMLGCMIETSLGISSAMNICYGLDFLDLDGHLLIAKDPFSLLSEEGGVLTFEGLH
jgi:glutamate racemase